MQPLRSATLHYMQQEDLTLAKIETKAATDAIDKFHAFTAALNFLVQVMNLFVITRTSRSENKDSGTHFTQLSIQAQFR
jgi:hypothetical protein